MKFVLFSALLLLILMDHGVYSAPENHPEPLSIFKDSSTFYEIHRPINDRLVPAFEQYDSGESEGVLNRQEAYPELDNLRANEIYTRATLPEPEFYDFENSSISNNDSEHDSSLMNHIPSALKVIYSWKALLTDFIDTVHKATRIYQGKREELLSGVNETSARSAAQYTSLSSALLDIVLSPRSLDELIEVSRSAQSEEEVLQGLTSVVLRSEGRSGSSLTLDPVTVIALLTLAAYLIRAVYQILITNSNGRSIGFLHPSVPGIFDLPENMAGIIDAITALDFDDARFARAADDEERGNSLEGSGTSGVLSLPGSVAAITKLRREGHSGCINLYTCEQLAHKNIFSYSLEDVLVVSMGAYLGDVKLWPLLSPGSTPEELAADRCGDYRGFCKQKTLREARHLRDLFTEASSKLLRLLSSAREARRRSYVRRSSARSVTHT